MVDFDRENTLGVPSKRRFSDLFHSSEEQQENATSRIEDARRGRAVQQLEVSRDTNPDQAAEHDQLSRDLGVPYEAVAAAPDEAAKVHRTREFSDLFRDAEVTTEFISKPAYSRLAHDSVRELSFIEGIGNSLVRGWLGVKQGFEQFQAEGEFQRYKDSDRTFGEILGSIDTLDKIKVGNLGGFSEALYRYATSRVLPSSREDYLLAQKEVGDVIAERMKFGMSGVAQQFMESVEESEGILNKLLAVASNPKGMSAFGAEVGLEFLPQLITAGAVTYATRNPALGAATIGTLSGATERYRSPAEFLSAAGIDITDPEQLDSLIVNPQLMKEAQEYGFTRGAIIGAFDAVAGGLASKALAKNPVVSLALQTALQGALGGGGEASAQLATTGEIDINEVIFETVGEFATAPIDVATVGGRPLAARAKDMISGARAEATAEGLKTLSDAMQESPLTERAPDAAADHMASVLANNGVTEINVPASVINSLEDVDVAQLIEDLGVGDQMHNASQYDGDVAVPVREFVRHILQNPELTEKLRSHVRVDPEGVTYTESLEIDEETEAAIKEAEEESARALEEQEGPEEVSRDTTPVSHDEQVAQIAEHETGVAALFGTADEAGFTETQYASYIEAVQRIKDGARKAVEKRRLNREKKRLEKEYQETRESFRQEVEESISQEPIYQAIQGIGVDRLDYDAVRRILQDSDEAMKRLPEANGQRIYTRKGVKGLDPDQYADIYGFSGGDVMLFAFLDNPSFEQAVNRELDARVEREIPTNISLQQEVAEALEEMHKPDDFGTVLAFELARLRKMRGKKRIKQSLIRARAKNILTNYRVGSIRPAQLETLQRREARRARKALRAGDLEAAAKHKLNQAVAYEMTRESYKIQREVEKGNKALRKLQVQASQTRKRGKQRGLPIDHLEKIKEVLDKFSFGTRSANSRRLQSALDERPNPQQEGESLRDWAKRKSEEEGIVMYIGPTVENADGTVNWQNLTLSEWRDVKNTVSDIAKAGRDADKLRNQIEGYGLDQIVSEVSSNMKSNLSKNVPREAAKVAEVTDVKMLETMASNAVDAWKKLGVNISNVVLNVDSLLRRIDGWQSLGPAYRFVKGGIDRAFTEGYTPGQVGFARRMKAESQKLNELFATYSKTERNMMWREQDIPGVRQRLTRLQKIGVLLNMGNAENIQAMIQSGQFTEMELQAIVDSADKKDLDFAQGIWDYLDSFKPEIRSTVRRRQNRNPVMVEAQALETKHGVYRGGYFPLQYDMDLAVLGKSEEARLFDFEEARDMMLRGGFTSSHTQDGHTQTRQGSGKRPVKLDPFVLQQHMGQLIYDLEMGDAVNDAYKVLHHPEMKQAFTDQGMPQMWEAIDLWLGDVITGELHRGGFVEGSLRHIRTGTTISRLAFNFTTAALQPLGLLQSSVLIGKANVFRGLFQLAGGRGQNPMAVVKWVTEQSGFMMERERSFNKDIHDAQRGLNNGLLKRITPGDTADYIGDAFFLFIAKAQRFVDIVTWLGAYHQGMQQFGNDVDASRHADRMVARSQGSGNFHERTNFERGTISRNVRNTEMVRTWSLFLSYFAAKMNVAYERTKKVDIKKNPIEVINYPVDMALLFMVEGTLAALIREGMDDDEENNVQELVGLALWEGTKNFAAGIPFVRETVSAAEGFNTGGAVGGFMAGVGNLGIQVSQGELDAAAVKAANNLLGTLFKYPTSQVHKTGQAVWEDDPWNEVEWWEYFTGVRREQ